MKSQQRGQIIPASEPLEVHRGSCNREVNEKSNFSRQNEKMATFFSLTAYFIFNRDFFPCLEK